MKSESIACLRCLAWVVSLLVGTALPWAGYARDALTPGPVPTDVGEGSLVLTSGASATDAGESRVYARDTLASALSPTDVGEGSLGAAFRTCVSLYGQRLAGALMRTIGDRAARDAFAQAHSPVVRSFSIEREHGYATATAKLNEGIAVAGVPVRAIYASTCELDCPLAVWGLEFGAVTEQQLKALRAWTESAPSTHTDRHGDIKVQLSATPDGESILVCDVSD
jgi:hypothetical protein